MTPFLAAFSVLYRIGLAFDKTIRSLFASTLSLPVISIGNLTWGGTGKTPLVLKTVHDIQTLGGKPAILTRGYAGLLKSSNPIVYSDGSQKSHMNGADEPRLLADKCPGVPIGVGANRRKSAKRIEASFHPSVFVLDDGFQHWPIKRTLDIVCIDATDPFGGTPVGGNHLIPWGRLREPLSALSRAHVVVLTRTELLNPEETETLRKSVKKWVGTGHVLTSRFITRFFDSAGHPVEAETLRSKNIVAVSGIGNPNAFENGLRRMGGLVLPMRFSDHQTYTSQHIERIEAQAENASATVVTTEKDWIKLKTMERLTGSPLMKKLLISRVGIEMNPHDEHAWTQALQRALKNPV
jgi:tetraacyldisaccharide 4'-kinase